MSGISVQYIADDEVSISLDRELRSLLTTCFTRTQDDVFRHRRYWKEPPAHRWIMRSAEGDLVAHVAAHDKTCAVSPHGAGSGELRIAGIAEVCVHPSSRRRGYVKEILGVSHHDLERMEFDFAALFGNPEVYRSSGYLLANNPVQYYSDTDGTEETVRFDGREGSAFLWRPVCRSDWPKDVIDLRGPRF